jgi:Fur family transcriptional regulator, ferric uptake regulator
MPPWMATRPDRTDSPLRDALRGAGLRVTPSRIAVLRLLRASASPLSHADVADRLDDLGFDRATLYRNLLDLTEKGMARRTDVGDHVWRFEAIGTEADAREHPHFVCNQCGRVECLPDVTVTMPKGVRAPKAIRQNEIEVQMKGVCDSCT